MILATIALCLTVVLCFVTWGILIRAYAEAKQREIEERISAAIRDYVEPQPDGKPSKLGQTLEAAGYLVGRAAAQSIMGSLNADTSHAVRAANDMAAEHEAQVNPMLHLLKGGKRGRGAALETLAGILMSRIGGNNGGSSGGSSGGSQGQFPLS